MNKWQKAYLRGAYRGKSPGALYRERLGTVQDALDWIDDGDCLTWSTHGSEPKVFLEHLHTIAPRLEKGIDCWNTISRYDYPVTRDPALAGRFRHHTFFFDRWSVAALLFPGEPAQLWAGGPAVPAPQRLCGPGLPHGPARLCPPELRPDYDLGARLPGGQDYF